MAFFFVSSTSKPGTCVRLAKALVMGSAALYAVMLPLLSDDKKLKRYISSIQRQFQFELTFSYSPTSPLSERDRSAISNMVNAGRFLVARVANKVKIVEEKVSIVKKKVRKVDVEGDEGEEAKKRSNKMKMRSFTFGTVYHSLSVR